MVYVNSDGRVCERQPFSLSSITRFFWGFINFFYMFLSTLVNPTLTKNDSRYSTDYRPPGSGPPRPPNNFRGFGGSSGGPPAPPSGGCGCG